MESTSIRFSLILLLSLSLLAISGSAQTARTAATGIHASTSSALTSPSSPSAFVGSGTKIGIINIEQAIMATNEGRHDFDELTKKLQPKQAELKSRQDELDGLKRQLNTQSATLNDDARNDLARQIDMKQRSFDRDVQEARDDANNQQQEIAQRILRKMAPMVVKYAADNGYGMVLDSGKGWPESPVVWFGQSVDITKAIVDQYNAKAGTVAPSTSGSAARTPSAPKASGATAPAAKPQPPK